MATYVETKIFEGLLNHLSGLTLSPTMSIAWPGVAFTPPAAGYLRVRHFPNVTDQVTLGTSGKNRHVGTFQVEVLWPQDGGESTPKERAGAIVARFKRGTSITRESVIIRIIRPPSIAPSLEEPPYLSIPVSIRYQADTDNPT